MELLTSTDFREALLRDGYAYAPNGKLFSLLSWTSIAGRRTTAYKIQDQTPDSSIIVGARSELFGSNTQAALWATQAAYQPVSVPL